MFFKKKPKKYYSHEAGRVVDETYTSGGATMDFTDEMVIIEEKKKCDHIFSPPKGKSGDVVVGEIWGDFEVMSVCPDVSCFASYKCKKCGEVIVG